MSHSGNPTAVGHEARPVARPWNHPDQTAPMKALAPAEAEVVLRRARRSRRREDTQQIWHLTQETAPVEPPRDALPAVPVHAEPAAHYPEPAPAPPAIEPVAAARAPQAPVPDAPRPSTPSLAWPFAAVARPAGPFEDLTASYDRPLRRWSRRLLSLFRPRRR